MNKKSIKVMVSFILLFVLYHAAEYMIVFKNNAAGFLGFQLLFFVLAWLLGKWYNGKGLDAWGLSFQGSGKSLFLIGILAGVFIYALPLGLSLLLGYEAIASVPEFSELLMASLPFAFGVFFSSFSEDVLTRGLIFTGWEKQLAPPGLILLSASIYLLNHIYRLKDGPEAWLYLFLLGVVFIIPLIFTKSLWLTGGMHWAGNVFFFVTHDVIRLETKKEVISGNYLFAICLAVSIPIIWLISKKLERQTEDQSLPSAVMPS